MTVVGSHFILPVFYEYGDFQQSKDLCILYLRDKEKVKFIND